MGLSPSWGFVGALARPGPRVAQEEIPENGPLGGKRGRISVPPRNSRTHLACGWDLPRHVVGEMKPLPCRRVSRPRRPRSQDSVLRPVDGE